MGMLLEAHYKPVISGRESPLTALQKNFPGSSPNPLQGKEPESAKRFTYEKVNRDSAVLFAREAVKEKVGALVYLSAAAGPPGISARYLSTKLEAESIIARELPQLRSAFIRAPFMFDSSRAFTVPLAAIMAAGAVFNNATGGVLSSFLGAAGVKPLKADVVADAVVEALSDETVRGAVEVPQLEQLANSAWRNAML